MIQLRNSQTKTDILKRLARIEGQLRGVQKMIDEDRDCSEVVQQLIAIRSAVHSASLSFVQDAASECLLDPVLNKSPQIQQQNLTDLVKLLGKLS